MLKLITTSIKNLIIEAGINYLEHENIVNAVSKVTFGDKTIINYKEVQPIKLEPWFQVIDPI